MRFTTFPKKMGHSWTCNTMRLSAGLHRSHHSSGLHVWSAKHRNHQCLPWQASLCLSASFGNSSLWCMIAQAFSFAARLIYHTLCKQWSVVHSNSKPGAVCHSDAEIFIVHNPRLSVKVAKMCCLSQEHRSGWRLYLTETTSSRISIALNTVCSFVIRFWLFELKCSANIFSQ